MKVTYSTLYMAGIGSAGAFYIDAGLHMALSKRLFMGMHAVNLNAARWSSETEERYPSLIKIGLGYHLSEKLQVFAQGEKDLFYPFGVQTGLAYQLVEALQLRIGVNQLQESLHGGFGFRYGKLDISFASRHHQALGFTHHAAFRLDF
ncbi:hypothetical protein [Nitritalea halalkaliphila]|nr:hypothetical protein [Nitritalea halalkaliphila]